MSPLAILQTITLQAVSRGGIFFGKLNFYPRDTPRTFYTPLVGVRSKLKNSFELVFPIVENPRVEKISRFGAIFENRIFSIFKGVTPNFLQFFRGFFCFLHTYLLI